VDDYDLDQVEEVNNEPVVKKRDIAYEHLSKNISKYIGCAI
jgi:hypothetical protein